MAIFVMIAPVPDVRPRLRIETAAESADLLRWVRRPLAAPVVICLPHAGGSVLSCLALAAALPEELGIATVALPGHEVASAPASAPTAAATSAPASPPVADVRVLAAALAREIARDLASALAPDGAGVTLLGNSFGALLGFETAVALEQGPPGPAARLHLVVSGFRSPSRPPLEAPLHRLPRAVLLAELRECFGAPGPDVGDWLGAREEAALRADLEACETYRPEGARLRCPVGVVRLTRDPSVSAAECAAWAEVCAGPIDWDTLDAGHFPWSTATAAFARLVGDRIARLTGGPTPPAKAERSLPSPFLPPS